MFNLHEINLFNFRTYQGSHKFKFPIAEGLYFFTGENNVALGSNGAGKSTLLDAIVWVLYGRTTRGLKANEVISWGATACQVSLELTIGRNRFKVKRSQKPNGIFLDNKPVDQKELEKHLRLTCEAFLYSVINAQFGTPFLALSPSEKLNLFSDIMNLDYWLEKSREASSQATSYEDKIAGWQNTLSKAEGQRETVIEDIASLKLNESTFDKGKQAEIAKISKLQNKAHEEFLQCHKLISENKAMMKWEKIALNNLDEDLRIILLDNDNMLAAMADLASKKKDLVKNKELLEEQLAKFEDIISKGGKCPTCFQLPNNRVWILNTSSLSRYIDEANSHIRGTSNAIVAITKSIAASRSKIRVKSSLVDEQEVKINDLKDASVKLEMQLSSTRMKMEEFDNQLEALESKPNPYVELLGQKKEKLAELETTIKTSTYQKKLAEEMFEASSFWVNGFKRVRLFIIEQAFRTLEIEVNNSLAQLGMADWSISFDVERENKSGGVTKGFVVFVKSPANKAPVRWENWSGGETQRLQLAGDLGLANLIMQRAGLTNTIEFYDEPSTHLSHQGMVDLANMLHERALSEGKRIWIVDHTAITNFGEFEGVITVRKSNNGSNIIYNGN